MLRCVKSIFFQGQTNVWSSRESEINLPSGKLDGQIKFIRDKFEGR